MKPISIIGMGLSPANLTSTHIRLIEEADVLVGGKRHLEFFRNSSAEKKEIDKNLKDILKYIRNRKEGQDIVVLASGDPLFFGIGSFLVRSLGAENVRVHPNITSVAAAFSRLREPWHDVQVISIHGRFSQEILNVFAKKDKIAVLTDPEKNPAWLANFLIENHIRDFRMCVLEQLGTDAEHFGWHDLRQAAGRQFADPNIAVLWRIPLLPEHGQRATKTSVQLHIGMQDENYEHEKGLITKAEVRAVTLSKLRLHSSDHTLWDMGAGSGSVSIEASLFIKKGKIFALEQKHDRIKQIEKNKNRFGISNLKVVQAELPGGMEELPKPDRIFIGGGGKNLRKIITAAADHLRQEGVMVINTVLLQNMEAALSALKAVGFRTDIIQIQISKGRDMPWGERLEAQNPVWIISGVKNWELGSNPPSEQ